MSRAYDMYLEVKEFQPKRSEAIKTEAEAEWPFEWFTDASDLLEGMGESSLCGGESEQEFADRLAKAVWQANGGSCAVLVTATYLENLPCETYEFDEEAFERLSQQPEGTSP
jgi:hypothetical protein